MHNPDYTPAPTLVARFRAKAAIAVGSGVPASVPALILTGSIALCALIAVLTVAGVALADRMI